MKKSNIMAVLVGAVALCGAAQAEWGKGLGEEQKTTLVPWTQQSGWNGASGPVETKPAPAAKAVEPVKAEPAKPVEAAKPADSDRDGVVDASDACADTPHGTAVDDMGCPKMAKAVPEKDWTLSGVQFESGSDRLKSNSLGALDEAAEILKAHPRVVVEIQGHTDNVGSANVNTPLSERRAQAVRRYLVSKGIEEKRLEARGYGDAKPVADNSNSTGRAQNRRIDFKVLKK